MSFEWTWTTTLRRDCERRVALVELDALTTMEKRMNLEQIKTIYRIQVSALQQFEVDIWYDAYVRIAFAINHILSDVGAHLGPFEIKGERS